MTGMKDLTNIWQNVKEIDLRPLGDAATRPLKLLLIGSAGSGLYTLADWLQVDPTKPELVCRVPLEIVDLDMSIAEPETIKEKVILADLVIFLVPEGWSSSQLDQTLLQLWGERDNLSLIIYNQVQDFNTAPGPSDHLPVQRFSRRDMLVGDVGDPVFMSREFVPTMMKLLSGHLLALSRQYPAFRIPVARHLINDTSMSNAAYALSTGLAEIVPVLDIPLNIADMAVLTKAQAFLVYKLGLAFGMTTRWQTYLAEFGGVLGGGFLWRQMARMLVGFIPAWGIVPKVAISYAGTFVVGSAVLHWYQTGRHLPREKMRQLFIQALARGKRLAKNMVPRIKRPRLFKRRQKKRHLLMSSIQICRECDGENADDARFCQYCGEPLKDEAGESLPAGQSGSI